MVTKKQKEILKEALDIYGEEPQLDMVVEECSELILAICKYRRNLNNDTLDNFIEEIADVEIMIEQAKMILNTYDRVEERKEYKINRLSKRLKANT